MSRLDEARKQELLRGSPYFSGLSDDLIAEVSRIAIVREYGPGERIFTEGRDEGKAALHIVADGLVRVYKLSSGGREQVLRLMRPGDTFSDVPVFDGGPYPASCDAVELSTVLAIPRRTFMPLMEEHPEMAIGALHNIAARLRHMTNLVEDLSLRRVMSRVARLLLENQESGIQLNQTQMATMVGTAREMVNRSLHALADASAIDLRGQQIVVLDEAKLREIVDAG